MQCTLESSQGLIVSDHDLHDHLAVVIDPLLDDLKRLDRVLEREPGGDELVYIREEAG